MVDDTVDPRLPWGTELRALATALTCKQGVAQARAREALVAVAGPAVAAAAVGVCATFEMMNRLVDAAGCPIPEFAQPVAADMGLDLAEVAPAHLLSG